MRILISFLNLNPAGCPGFLILSLILVTPLTSIRMHAELLLSGRVKDAAKKETYLSVIMTENQRLTRLVNNVLDFGKLEQVILNLMIS